MKQPTDGTEEPNKRIPGGWIKGPDGVWRGIDGNTGNTWRGPGEPFDDYHGEDPANRGQIQPKAPPIFTKPEDYGGLQPTPMTQEEQALADQKQSDIASGLVQTPFTNPELAPRANTGFEQIQPNLGAAYIQPQVYPQQGLGVQQPSTMVRQQNGYSPPEQKWATTEALPPLQPMAPVRRVFRILPLRRRTNFS